MMQERIFHWEKYGDGSLLVSVVQSAESIIHSIKVSSYTLRLDAIRYHVYG